MRIGVNTSPLNAQIAANAGFDYIEANCNWIRSTDEKGIEEAFRALSAAGLRAESANGFFSAETDLYFGDRKQILVSVRETLQRAAYLGCKIGVVGSGKARNIPEGMTRENAAIVFCELLAECADIAAENGIALAVEPLRYCESNFVNTVCEGVEIAKAVNKPNVGGLVDFFHFWCNGEPLSELDTLGNVLIHTHLARPNDDRRWPLDEDLPVLETWAGELAKIGYKWRMSLECSWGGAFEEKAAEARRNLRMFDAV